ncbi:MAG: alpha/beta hydrolase [Gammaproteobacteria bacterium]|nr:alpha/beta hydrolase [Gammaproteobacteria bacterium]
MSPLPPFAPRGLLRNASLQSFLASWKFRNRLRGDHPMQQAAVSQLLDCGDGVRLTGVHSPLPAGRRPRALAILFHGWEGSDRSAYLYSMACSLFDAGYSVFRLNLRDHADTHHLNEEMFHSARMDEVYGAMRSALALDEAERHIAIGFSLGGNFALRVGLRAPDDLLPAMTVGVCPAINPRATMQAIDDASPLFRRYFMSKWQDSLQSKARAWPQRYDFGDIAQIRSFMDITERFVIDYTEFETLSAYFDDYDLRAELRNTPRSPLTIVTAQDDPVIPFEDFVGLGEASGVRLIAPSHGGHCGFIDDWRLRSWVDTCVLAVLDKALD